MNEVERISNQMRRAFERGAWCGSSLSEVLADVTPEEAAARPVPGGLSMWQMVLHLAAWKRVVRQRLEGRRVRLPEEGDFPAVGETSAEAWRGALALLARRHVELLGAVAELDPARLDEPIVEGMSTVYETLHGSLQHDLYHGSQMALLKRLQRHKQD